MHLKRYEALVAHPAPRRPIDLLQNEPRAVSAAMENPLLNIISYRFPLGALPFVTLPNCRGK
jgi:hypothetical protein